MTNIFAGAGSLDTLRDMFYDPDVTFVSDFDHTLAETSDLHSASFNATMEQVTGSTIKYTQDLVQKLRGKSPARVLQVIHRELGLSELSAKELLGACALQEEIITDLMRDDINPIDRLMPGVHSLVQMLVERERRSGIATQSPESMLYEFFRRIDSEALPIRQAFPSRAIIGQDQLRSEHARHPQIRHSLCKPANYSIYLAARIVGRPEHYPILYAGDGREDALAAQFSPEITGLIVISDDNKRAALAKEFH